MKVVSLIRRQNGHVLELRGTKYRFAPPSYACDVTNQDHLEWFRSVPEGYSIEAKRAAPRSVKTGNEAGR